VNTSRILVVYAPFCVNVISGEDMRLIASLLAAAGVLGGCATLVTSVSRESDVVASFGTPAETRQLADGGRVLEYPKQPFGTENWRVTLNADGTVRSMEQLIDEAHFAKVRRGMSVDEVLRELGRPSEKKAFANSGETVLSWGYMVPDQRMQFNAHFDAASGRLKRTSRTPDPTWPKSGQAVD
jgi:hypothetical protein